MSATLVQVAAKVRVHINDVAARVFEREVVYGKINSALLGTIATRLRLGRTYLASALTIGTSTNTYTMPSAAQYQIVRQVHLQGSGNDLEMVSPEMMAAMQTIYERLARAKVRDLPGATVEEKTVTTIRTA